MPSQLNVYSLPSVVEPESLRGGAVVVIDVLRASTTMVYALEAGAIEVIPCLEVDQALAAVAQTPSGEVVLGGERNGLPIEGFDLGNSPEEYTPEAVGGRVLVFTTTNGTRAIYHARLARRCLIGAFVNAAAVVERLLNEEAIHLLCAGTGGQISQDDVLLAGMLVERLQRAGGMAYELNAQAITARESWMHSFALPKALGAEPLEPEVLAKELRKSLGGKHLVALDLEDDILAAAAIDRFGVVPELEPATMRICPAE